MNVNVVLKTKDQAFGSDVADTNFLYELLDETGEAVDSVKAAGNNAVFTDVGNGTYTVRASKLGVEATSESFAVGGGETGNTFQVPDTVTVTIG